MTVHTRVAKPLVDSLRKALTSHALPGETVGLTREAERGAAEFLAGVAVRRRKGEVALAIESRQLPLHQPADSALKTLP